MAPWHGRENAQVVLLSLWPPAEVAAPAPVVAAVVVAAAAGVAVAAAVVMEAFASAPADRLHYPSAEAPRESVQDVEFVPVAEVVDAAAARVAAARAAAAAAMKCRPRDCCTSVC